MGAKITRSVALAWALVVIAGSSPGISQNTKVVATSTDAEVFIAKAEADLAKADESANRAAWLADTYTTVDTSFLEEAADAQRASLGARFAEEGARYDGLASLDPTTLRKLVLIKRGNTLSPPSTPGAAEKLSALSARLASNYLANTVLYRGSEESYQTLNRILSTSKDPVEQAFLWQEWRRNLSSMRNDYSALVDLANAGARELKYRDAGALWRSSYDMPEADFATVIDGLWSQVEPLFKKLHCYVRGKLNDTYGSAVQPRTGPIRADLLGHLSAWKWDGIFKAVAPQSNSTPFDLTALLVNQNYDAVKIVRTAENFYTSLGFEPLPESFWQRSMLSKPSDRKLPCRLPSAWSIDGREDLRIKACFEPNAYAFYTAHHELGHLFYYRAYKDQPYLFKDGANDGFHEAIGDFISLYASTSTYLNQIGLLPNISDAESDIPDLLRSALAHVAVLPFGIIIDKWRWRVFAGETPPDKYNIDWWALVRQYQGLVPPGLRSADGFDPGAHQHIPDSTPYTRYFLAEIYQFQFYRAACRLAGWTGPLNRCSIFGNKAVGNRLKAMLQLGASKPWRDALEVFTGERDADAGAILEYFAPLARWMTDQNKGESCGW